LPQSLFIDWNVTYNREARAKEAYVALKILGHNLQKGPLLDVGCGGGDITRWFNNELNVKTVGLEVTRASINSMKQNMPQLTSGSAYLLASGVNLPFTKKLFHTVVLNDVLEHISYSNAVEAFKQVYDALDDDGMFYVSVASKFEFREPHSNMILISWLPRWIYAPIVRKKFHDDVYPYTVARFRKLAKQTGFNFENVTYLYVTKKVQNLNYIGNKILRPLVRALNRIGLTRKPGFLRFLEPFGVLVFVCKKTKK
jgi:cyclopropane fatty-acyl-phospholipid synthase-like methyltransferase